MRDLDRYRQAASALEATQNEIEELEQTEAFDVFQKQLGLLRKRLLDSPQSLRQMFVDDGMQAIVWEFKQDELGPEFTKTLWRLLLRDDDMSALLLRFIWNVPLKFKRKFIVAIDAHLSDRYPMFKGLSQGWPGQNGIPPYIRSPEERARDFELVNQGYLGYMNLGYSAARGRSPRVARDAARQAVRGPAPANSACRGRAASRRAAARSRSTSPRCCSSSAPAGSARRCS